MLNALVDFATDGFESLTNLVIGLITLAAISHQVNVRSAERAHHDAATPVSANA